MGLALHLGRENLQDSFPLPSDKETAQDIPFDPRPESWGQGSKSRMGGTGRALFFFGGKKLLQTCSDNSNEMGRWQKPPG